MHILFTFDTLGKLSDITSYSCYREATLSGTGIYLHGYLARWPTIDNGKLSCETLSFEDIIGFKQNMPNRKHGSM